MAGLTEQQEVRSVAEHVQQRLGQDEAGQREQFQEQPQLAPDDRTHTPPQEDRSGARRRGGALVGILRHDENLHQHGGWSLVQSGAFVPYHPHAVKSRDGRMICSGVHIR